MLHLTQTFPTSPYKSRPSNNSSLPCSHHDKKHQLSNSHSSTKATTNQPQHHSPESNSIHLQEQEEHQLKSNTEYHLYSKRHDTCFMKSTRTTMFIFLCEINGWHKTFEISKESTQQSIYGMYRLCLMSKPHNFSFVSRTSNHMYLII